MVAADTENEGVVFLLKFLGECIRAVIINRSVYLHIRVTAGFPDPGGKGLDIGGVPLRAAGSYLSVGNVKTKYLAHRHIGMHDFFCIYGLHPLDDLSGFHIRTQFFGEEIENLVFSGIVVNKFPDASFLRLRGKAHHVLRMQTQQFFFRIFRGGETIYVVAQRWKANGQLYFRQGNIHALAGHNPVTGEFLIQFRVGTHIDLAAELLD